MLFSIGFMVWMLGLMMGDSELLIVPVAVSLVGLAMMYGGREVLNDEDEIEED